MAGETLDELLAVQEQRAQRQQQVAPQLQNAQGGGLLDLIRGIIGLQGGAVPQEDPREQRRKLEELRIKNELSRLGIQQ